MFNFKGRLIKVLNNLHYERPNEYSYFYKAEINGIKITRYQLEDEYQFYIDYNGTEERIGYLYSCTNLTFLSSIDKNTKRLLKKRFKEIILNEENIIELKKLTDKQRKRIEDKKLNNFIQSMYY